MSKAKALARVLFVSRLTREQIADFFKRNGMTLNHYFLCTSDEKNIHLYTHVDVDNSYWDTSLNNRMYDDYSTFGTIKWVSFLKETFEDEYLEIYGTRSEKQKVMSLKK